MTRTGAAARPDLDERAQNFFDWVAVHTREVAIGAVVVVLFGLGTWIYSRTQYTKRQNAARALAVAENDMAAGNTKLAQSDLEKLLANYGGTSAAMQGALLLAQIDYDAGQFQPGIDVLTKHSEKDANGFMSAAVENMVGVGYEEMGKLGEAADHYKAAAAKAEFSYGRDSYLANAARAYALGGNTAAAAKIWQDLAKDPTASMAAEARVRLGELEAKPAKARG